MFGLNGKSTLFKLEIMSSFLQLQVIVVSSSLFDVRLVYAYKGIVVFLHLNRELTSDQKCNLNISV